MNMHKYLFRLHHSPRRFGNLGYSSFTPGSAEPGATNGSGRTMVVSRQRTRQWRAVGLLGIRLFLAAFHGYDTRDVP